MMILFSLPNNAIQLADLSLSHRTRHDKRNVDATRINDSESVRFNDNFFIHQ